MQESKGLKWKAANQKPGPVHSQFLPIGREFRCSTFMDHSENQVLV
jgi:hypothetical protein